MPTTAAVPLADVDAVRHFNRVYTRLAGALDEGHLDSPYSLAEVRVLYELANREAPTAGDIGRDLQLDAGYLSRLLKTFDERGLVTRTPSPHDGRQSLLTLTQEGRRLFTDLQTRARSAVSAQLLPLNAAERAALLSAMVTIETLLTTPVVPDHVDAAPYTLRAHRPGDMGWVVRRHAEIYAGDYGWAITFEALVARIAADFLDHFDPSCERCWIAERDGERVGCVFVVKHPEREGTAKLRMLLVDPSARGLGLGKRLVRECTAFARASGYHTLTLWTNDILHTARALYEAEGYRLVSEERHHSFGVDLVGQYWELAL